MSFFVELTDMFRLRNKLIVDCERVALLCPNTTVDLSEPIWAELSTVAEALQQTNSTLQVFVAVHRERAAKLYDLCKRTYWTLVSRTSLIEQFAAHADTTSTARRIINLAHFPIIGDSPNDASLSELTQIPSIADFSDLMCVRANAFILCRAITAAASSCGLVFVAEDRLGNTFRVHAFYCATLKPEWAATKAHLGLVVAIKNPALTLCGSSWEPTLRCGHESNFVPIFDISDPLLADTPWFVAPCRSSFDWNTRGNDHFTKREFRSAIAAYTRGLALNGGKRVPALVDLLTNRANALLNLGRWRAALDDTNAVLALEGAHRKCVMRRALALSGLRRYREALDDWMNSAVICRDLPVIKNECIVGAAEAMMLHRQAAGQFDWQNVAKHVLAKGSSRVTTYVNPKVRVSATTIARRQFGVFAREAIARGTLLVVEPPLAVTSAESTDKSGLLRFVDDVLLQCERDEKKMAQVMELCGASHFADSTVPRDDGTFGSLVKLMCKSNSTQFRMPWNSTSASDLCLGLFPEVTRFNHSCDPNCSLVIIGNFAIIQTVEDIAADQELFVAQIPRTMYLPREGQCHSRVAPVRVQLQALCFRVNRSDMCAIQQRIAPS
jgi:hypothetical protein